MVINKIFVRAYNVYYLQKITDASSLLTATCDTFIRTLEDIMKLMSNATSITNSVPYEMPVPHIAINKNSSNTSKTTSNKNLLPARSTSQENR